MIKYPLAIFQSFSFMDILLVETAVKTFITGILEDAIILICDDSGFLGRACKA